MIQPLASRYSRLNLLEGLRDGRMNTLKAFTLLVSVNGGQAGGDAAELLEIVRRAGIQQRVAVINAEIKSMEQVRRLLTSRLVTPSPKLHRVQMPILKALFSSQDPGQRERWLV